VVSAGPFVVGPSVAGESKLVRRLRTWTRTKHCVKLDTAVFFSRNEHKRGEGGARVGREHVTLLHQLKAARARRFDVWKT
jgi:hypothetical protein